MVQLDHILLKKISMISSVRESLISLYKKVKEEQAMQNCYNELVPESD